MRRFRRVKAGKGARDGGGAPPRDSATSEAPARRAPFAAIISLTFLRASLRDRVHLLRALLAPLGPLALAALAGGAFAKYLTRGQSPEIEVSLGDAAAITSRQVLELARYVEQAQPQLVDQFWTLLGPDPLAVAAAAATVVAVMVRVMRPRPNDPLETGAPGR